MSTSDNRRILQTALTHFSDPATRERYFDLYDPSCVLHGYPGVEPGIATTHRGAFMGVPATGKRIEFGGITILQFRSGRCVERWSQADFLGVLQQLGAIPAP